MSLPRRATLGVLLAAASGFAAAGEPSWIGRRPPELTGPRLVWINHAPLTLAGLRGKVVLLDIWDGTCINCLRTIPYLKAWHQHYAAAGLVIIGIHCPEFAFERDPAIVKEFLAAQGITYPVVADNGYEVWNAFHNQVWPRKWLVDRAGVIRADHAGEGDYAQTELELRRLLAEGNSGPGLTGAMAPVRPEDAPGAVCFPRSGELYLGSERGTLADGGATPAEGAYAVTGLWRHLPQSLSHATTHEGDAFRIRFHGTEVNCVMRSETGRPVDVAIRVDGRWVGADERGDDVVIGADGRSVVTVRGARMYRLINAKTFGRHALELVVGAAGFHAYAFTFGSCLVPKN